MTPFWTTINGREIYQGDLLKECLVPAFQPDFGDDENGQEVVPVSGADLIVVTQTCDLVQSKVELVALCPIYTLAEFEAINPKFSQKGKWEDVRKGRMEGLHLLASPEKPEDNKGAMVVDFGQIFSLPFDYLVKRTEKLGDRWRLDSPFLEHFSQAFARYFMRVGLPSSIPPFK
jgi:hypothetical protein